MHTNQLGKSDLHISEIGLGCMSIGTESVKAVKIIHEALEQGVNFLDTADLYDNGRNEELVGEAIRGRRSEVILATKVGNRRMEGQEGWVWDPSKAYIMEAVKSSLKRLNTDYIDLYQLHGGTIADPIDETIEAFERLKEQGWIRYYGISSIRPNVIREYANRSNIISVMNQYSILDRRAEEEVLPFLSQHGISVIARGPVAGGLLTENGKMKTGKGYLDYSEDELIAVRQELRLLTNQQRNMTQTAIRYPLSQPPVAAALCGASSIQQLHDNLHAALSPWLTAAEIETLQRVSHANSYTDHR